MSRQPWDQYFMEIAWKVSERATCNRLKVGCVLVKDRSIISVGYNGSLPGLSHCCDPGVGCLMENGHCVRTIHAEANAIVQAAKRGIATDNSIAYITHFPCLSCTKLLIQAGIKAIYHEIDYRIHPYALELLQSLNIKVKQIKTKG